MMQMRWRCTAPVVALVAAGVVVACGGGSGSASGVSSQNGNGAGTESGAGNTGSAVVTIPDAIKTSFTASDTDFPNPERGFYRFGADLGQLSNDAAQSIAQEGIRLVYTPQ